MANEDLTGGASEPADQAELIAGQYPTYAARKCHDSKLAVEEILFHCGLDRRPGERPDRTRMTLNCRWMEQPIKISICHCPASKKRIWDQHARRAVLPNVFRLAGLVPFDEWGGGAAEPAAWILDGDLKLGENTINNEMKNTSHHRQRTFGPDTSLGKLGHAPWRLDLGSTQERIPNVLHDRV